MDDHTHLLESFFSPQGIVIIGASTDRGKLGYSIARNLIAIGYPGAIHFVNPRGGELFGRSIYTEVNQVPDPVDLAVMLIPASATPEGLRQCALRGIHAVIIASGGFRETGPDGAKLEEALLEVARENNIRMIGPNCIGLIDTHYPLDTTFLSPPSPPKGDLAFISHSGATCAAIVDWSRGQGFGFSRLASLGNQIDIDQTDMLLAIGDDPNTHAIAFYLESVREGKRFISAAQKVVRRKPVVVLKAGRSSAGQYAAASHTGALAGNETAFDAAFQRSGVIRANTVEELFEWARTLASSPLPKGRDMAVLTDAGGMGVMASDALESNGLCLAKLTVPTHDALKAILPPAASVNNPIDMLASATPEQYAKCLSLLLADPHVNGVIVIMLPPPIYAARDTAKAILEVIKASDKPVLTALVGDPLLKDALEVFHREHKPDFRFPERAASAMSVLVKRAEYLAQDNTCLTPAVIEDRLSLHTLLQGAQPETFNEVLNAYGIPTLPLLLAHNSSEAVDLAHQIGFPVALKVASAEITHKSDVGGVLLNLHNAQAVKEGFDLIHRRIRSRLPDATLYGVTVQRMAPAGQEVILGALQDVTFGPMVMFGSGGIEVEGLKDVAFALAPLTRADALRMLESTWAGRKLKGYRNIAAADREAVLDALYRLAQLAADIPQLKEMEINPLKVLPPGQGVIALDVRGSLA